MPLARGGSNDRLNLQCLCPQCNLSKNAKDPIAWAREQGRLL
jgi:5-methylcytosine-specific restriction endonuclease McrA